MSSPVLVILAAGASTRLGEPKALVQLSEQAPRTPLELLLAAGTETFERTLVVSGADHAAIAAVLDEQKRVGVELHHNEEWALGRTGGVVLARDAEGGSDLCLAPVDVPLIPRSVFALLASAWRAAGSPPRGWLAPFCETAAGPRHGHPVIAGHALLAKLRADEPDLPLRELRRHADPLLAVPVVDTAVLDNLDTPADLERLRAEAKQRPTSSPGS